MLRVVVEVFGWRVVDISAGHSCTPEGAEVEAEEDGQPFGFAGGGSTLQTELAERPDDGMPY